MCLRDRNDVRKREGLFIEIEMRYKEVASGVKGEISFRQRARCNTDSGRYIKLL